MNIEWNDSHERIVCPYCDKENSVGTECEIIPDIEGETEMWCGHCDKQFHVAKEVEVWYKTAKTER